MKDLKLAALGLTTTVLIASNLITGLHYKQDINKYEDRIHTLDKMIDMYNVEIKKDKETISKDHSQMLLEQNQIYDLQKKLDQTNKENDGLKKQLAYRKKVDNRKLTVEASAYTSNCKGCSEKTFTGYNVNNTIEYNGYRVVAADLSILPLYSIVKIDTDNDSFKAIVIDTGGAIKGHKIDVLVNSYQDAIQFGRKKAEITVIKEGNDA